MHQLLRIVLREVRWCAFVLLGALRPVLIPLLSWLAVGGVLLWVVFVPIAHDTEFPTWRVFAISAGCGLGAVVYSLAVELLRPR